MGCSVMLCEINLKKEMEDEVANFEPWGFEVHFYSLMGVEKSGV